MSTTAEVDVLIVGAGISGIGAAHHLSTKRPGTTFAILDGRQEIGGTWSLFKYPGIRSDSDMPTFGYDFKPWTHEKSIAEAQYIVEYLQDTVDSAGIGPHIRFGHQVRRAEYATDTGTWTVTAERPDGETVEVTSRFLFLGTGYYDYEAGYTPEFAGLEDFEGQLVHPQHWPEDLDYTGKRVVVIGSGATAVTLIPSMARETAHITMLQRSPSYVLSIPSVDPVAQLLKRFVGQERAHQSTRRKNIRIQRGLYKLAQRYPKAVRKVIMADARRRLPKGYDVDTHFNPSYDPWDQRLCMVPDGDFFRSIRRGDASVVTDTIDRFVPEGIRLTSGRVLEADVVVTATGLNMLAFGRIELAVDGEDVSIPGCVVYKSMMLSNVPNFAFAFGYTNASWTLKVDLVCEHFCRLLDHMDAHGKTTFTPRLDREIRRAPLMDLSSGYVQRGIDRFPQAGAEGAWTVEMAYEADVARLREGPIEDADLVFGTASPREPATA
ncbi:SidA/IucD/PvdA family monooxygenase [Conexibacter sp. W3-3-2]|uniref:flavin-containing monooxygenase n=1 Tax=Conexibacter sp. W3-3-2 TaxID=2675227 RepID=UPI0012BA1C9D|nr:NAD(P)/FAD-dependent oxidoreductase [Conexibacter sp. W3-3-2]MTD46052.1 SidA/IucD/PvdA family monooxygenase [Conexibacter sp. W3-3-2]